MIKDNIADQLVYSTVRILCSNSTEIASGTGFFMLYENNPDAKYLAVVTNKHVVAGYSAATIEMVAADGTGSPVDTSHINITLPDLQKKCVFHPNPDVDMCFIFIDAEMKALRHQGKNPYYRCIGKEMLLRPEDYNSLTAIEDIIMIGYPNGIVDGFNYKPVVRKGITATNLKLDYNGESVFLIDAACFPGSSGSPVFLRKVGLEKEVTEKGITLGVSASYALLGILYAGPTLTIDGTIVIKDIPTTAKPFAEMKTMMNLGYVVKINRAVELFESIKLNKAYPPQ